MKKRKKCHYEESIKIEVLTDYNARGSSVRSITLKSGLSCTRVLLSCLQRYPIDGTELSFSVEVISKHMEKIDYRSNPRSEKALNQRIAELDKALW
ncbi:MAG: hypothetical protein ACK5N4_24070 [Parabacteroides gordonii]|uniref:hypothetical protein n=1 Tax=Parabacteroides gordonii TaxID=574930 RepID=UPI003A8AA1CA